MMRTTFGILAMVLAAGVLAWALRHHSELEIGVGTVPAVSLTPVHVAAHRAGS